LKKNQSKKVEGVEKTSALLVLVAYFEKEKKSQPTLKDISYYYLITELYVNAQPPGFRGSYELKFRP
jgi:hypothetical protein